MLRRVETEQDISQLGSIMSVWAHPDDETFLAAGVLNTAVRNGQGVVCVTATHGEQGSQDPLRWPQATLGEVRSREVRAALDVLGVDQHFWLDYADGGCVDVPLEEASGRLTELIRHFMPDTILTFGPDGYTGHDDHRSVSFWVSEAVREAGFRLQIYHFVQLREVYEYYLKPADERFNIFFNIDEPPLVEPEQCTIFFELPDETLEVKMRALAAMPSQTEKLLNDLKRRRLGRGLAVECFIEANGGTYG